MSRFQNLGIVKKQSFLWRWKFRSFFTEDKSNDGGAKMGKSEIVDLFHQMIPDFNHKETR